METIRQIKVEERVLFTEDERKDILKKSNGLCSHCGKKIFNGYNYTIDHFVPISKGGTNRSINLIPLCKDCNITKGQKIISPDEYIKYLNEKDLKSLKGYYNSYTHSFRYLCRTKFTPEDNFFIDVPMFSINNPKHNFRKDKYPVLKYYVRHAEYDDLDKIYNYYIKYTKKYGKLDNRSEEKQILDWYMNGAIYYAEKEGKVACMVVFRIVKPPNPEAFIKDLKYCFLIMPISLYSNERNGMLVQGVFWSVIDRILEYEKITYLPAFVMYVRKDKIISHIEVDENEIYNDFTNDLTITFEHILSNVKTYSVSEKTILLEKNKLIKFFKEATEV